MPKKKVLKGREREHLLNELQKRYATQSARGQKLTYMRKKYSWIIVVEGAKLLKRFIDIVFSIIFLIVFSPLMLLIALLIKVYDGGAVFYITNRVGKWGKEFRFPKFRTMAMGADQMQDLLKSDHKDERAFKMKEDPRITPIGQWLRKTSLDELPQLWSILMGDMSLVGPRPPLPKEVALYNLDDRKRLEVTPGLTGIWQISGRSEIPFEKQVKLDLKYIESQSFWLDIKILIQTIPAVILGRGAY